MYPHERIVADLARRLTRQLTAAVVRSLQRMTEGLTSGEDSGLATVWDEVCVQVQLERSFLWPAYEETVRKLIEDQLRELAPFEVSALWLQTDAGIDWSSSGQDNNPVPPVSDDDLIQTLAADVWNAAGNWSNPRIRAYLDDAARAG